MGLVTFRPRRGYGWSVDFGKRLRWSSGKSWCRAWPHFYRGADENCNRAVSLCLWPVGGFDVWWEPHWRTDADGRCDACRRDLWGDS